MFSKRQFSVLAELEIDNTRKQSENFCRASSREEICRQRLEAALEIPGREFSPGKKPATVGRGVRIQETIFFANKKTDNGRKASENCCRTISREEKT
jgi:hypothetical protein